MEESDILFWDNHLLVLNKSAGMLTQPNHSKQISLEEWGKKWIKAHFQKPGRVFLEAVHRLDRPVSGVVLFARTSKALSRMQIAMRQSQLQKEYLAIVEGTIQEKEGILEHFLVRRSFHTKVVDSSHKEAKRCRLKYHVLKQFNGYTLVKISLLTGRYHQIRAQFSSIGHPIVGDEKYDSKCNCEYLLLHHAKLSITHPISHNPLSWQAPLPFFWASTFGLSTCDEFFQ